MLLYIFPVFIVLSFLTPLGTIRESMWVFFILFYYLKIVIIIVSGQATQLSGS